MPTAGILTSKHREEWNKFTIETPEATFYHTFDWTEILRTGYEVVPSYWGLWTNDELAAIWPSFLVPAFGGKVLSCFAYATNGAPILKENLGVEQLRHVVPYALGIAKKENVLHWCFDVPEGSYFLNLGPKLGFQSSPSPRCAYTVDTTREPEALWKGLAREARKAVRRATRSGLTVRDTREPDVLTAFLSVYQSTMQRRQLTGLRNLYSLVPLLTRLLDEGGAKLFVVTRGERVVAGTILLLHEQVASGWIAGSCRDSWRMHPNELLFWIAIEWASESGFQTLDLGGNPSMRTHGLNQFKRHMGGKRVGLVRLVLPVDHLKHLLACSLVSTYRMFNDRGLIPTCFTDILLRRNLWFD